MNVKILLLFFFVVPLIGIRLNSQINCYNDSSLCFSKPIYPKAYPIVAEKKWESVNEINESRMPIAYDLNGDCNSELVIGNIDNSKLIVLDGNKGITINVLSTHAFRSSPTAFTIADVDFDKNPEIILAASKNAPNTSEIAGRLICYNSDGSLKWVSDQRYDNNQNNIHGTPAIADFNQDGIPEVYINNNIFNAVTGFKLIDGENNGLGFEGFLSFGSSAVSIAAQLDENDADLELAAGYSIYKVIINNTNGMVGNFMIPNNILIDNKFWDGYTTIADINNDNRLDVIVSSPSITHNKNKLYAFTLLNNTPTLIAQVEPIFLSGTINMGTPLIGRIDYGFDLSILVTIPNQLNSYYYDGTSLLKLKWSKGIEDDSGFVGGTIFDFNNDGLNEIVYRDESNLIFLNGSGTTPLEIASIPCISSTLRELPIVMNINGNSHVCVTCQNSKNDFQLSRLTVFGSPDTLPGWAPARGIWNQYNYHALNINDDGTVPQYMKNNSTYKNGKYNNFFVQESLLDSLGRYPQKAASLTGKIICVNYNTTTKQYEVNFDLNNRTDASLYAKNNLPVSFYNGNPETGGKLIGKYYTTDTIFSGSNLNDLTYTFSTDSITNLFLVVNTERDSLGSFKDHHFLQLECDYTDNFYQFFLPPITKTNAAVCNGESYNFYDDTLSTEGIYYHVIQNKDGCDSVILELDLSIEDTISIITTLSTCDTYIWNGNVYTQSGTYIESKTTTAGCDSIATLNLTINKSSNITTNAITCDTFSWLGTVYDETGIYTFATQTTAGCDSVLRLDLSVIPPDSIMLPRQEICEGDSIFFLGKWYKNATNATIKLKNQYDCDSFITFELRLIDTLKTNETHSICEGDSIRIFDEWESEEGTFTKQFLSTRGCDSISVVELLVNSVFVNNETLKICEGDSVFLFNEWKKTSGIYTQKYQTTNGCDSTEQVQLIVDQLLVNSDSILICDGDSVFVNGQSYSDEGSYQTILPSIEGCDTIYNFQLKYSPLLTKTENYSICEGDSILINGKYFSESESLKYIVEEENCKTEVTANIAIMPSTLTPQQFIICPDETITITTS